MDENQLVPAGPFRSMVHQRFLMLLPNLTSTVDELSQIPGRQVGDGRGACHGDIRHFYIQISYPFSSFNLYIFIEVLYFTGPRC